MPAIHTVVVSERASGVRASPVRRICPCGRRTASSLAPVTTGPPATIHAELGAVGGGLDVRAALEQARGAEEPPRRVARTGGLRGDRTVPASVPDDGGRRPRSSTARRAAPPRPTGRRRRSWPPGGRRARCRRSRCRAVSPGRASTGCVLRGDERVLVLQPRARQLGAVEPAPATPAPVRSTSWRASVAQPVARPREPRSSHGARSAGHVLPDGDGRRRGRPTSRAVRSRYWLT